MRLSLWISDYAIFEVHFYEIFSLNMLYSIFLNSNNNAFGNNILHKYKLTLKCVFYSINSV